MFRGAHVKWPAIVVPQSSAYASASFQGLASFDIALKFSDAISADSWCAPWQRRQTWPRFPGACCRSIPGDFSRIGPVTEPIPVSPYRQDRCALDGSFAGEITTTDSPSGDIACPGFLAPFGSGTVAARPSRIRFVTHLSPALIGFKSRCDNARPRRFKILFPERAAGNIIKIGLLRFSLWAPEVGVNVYTLLVNPGRGAL